VSQKGLIERVGLRNRPDISKGRMEKIEIITRGDAEDEGKVKTADKRVRKTEKRRNPSIISGHMVEGYKLVGRKPFNGGPLLVAEKVPVRYHGGRG